MIPTAAFISLELALKSTLTPPLLCWPNDGLPNVAAFRAGWAPMGAWDAALVVWGGTGEEAGNEGLMGRAGVVCDQTWSDECAIR